MDRACKNKNKVSRNVGTERAHTYNKKETVEIQEYRMRIEGIENLTLKGHRERTG